MTTATTLKIKPQRGNEFPRTFCAGVADFGDWTQLEPLFRALEARVAKLQSPEDLERWLLDESELAAALDEEYSRRYIAMTCNTADTEIEKAYLDYIENIHPKTKMEWDRLNRAYLASPVRPKMDRKRYEVMDRALENDVTLFREENVPLETENSKLSQKYQKTCGEMMVTYRGEEKTLQQMAPYLEETDRRTREEAWRIVADRRLKDREAIDSLYDQMIELRTRIARNAGFENYRDYQHREYGRFDYSPDDCIEFQNTIEKVVVPLLAKRRAKRKAELGLMSLRPWDLAVDTRGLPPLKPFADTVELESRCAKVFKQVDADLGHQFDQMRELGLLDLDSRKGKAPGGYQSNLEEVRYPFIFMNAAGTDRDLFTLLHEGGHAFHAFAARSEPLVAYRHAPIEFCEVASMSMELFAYGYLDSFYSADDARRSRIHHSEKLIELFPWVATIDGFQHWIYTNPKATRAEREAKWLELEERFSPGIDWSGLDAERRSLWHRQLHIFQCPFYYVEYGIAQLGALQLWLKSRRDFKGAVAGYRRGLALGGSRPLPELFEAAGAKFDFSVATVKPIMDEIERELEKV